MSLVHVFNFILQISLLQLRKGSVEHQHFKVLSIRLSTYLSACGLRLQIISFFVFFFMET